MSEPQRLATISPLLERYDAFLLDAFGVLVDGGGVRPAAVRAVDAIRAAGKHAVLVTNDASRSHESMSARYAAAGLRFDVADIISSGSLLPGALADLGLRGARVMVLGTDDSRDFVRAGGGLVLPLQPDADVDVVVVADDEGFPMLPGIEAVLSAVVHRVEAGRPPRLLLPNPDIIYPRAGGHLGITAGAVAALLDAGWQRRLGEHAPRWTVLGKPHAPIFEAAHDRLDALGAGSRRLMVGDQLQTDIAGAKNPALSRPLDAALVVGGGIAAGLDETPTPPPDWVLEAFAV